MTTTQNDLGTMITRTPGVCGGRPRIAGTGVSIRRIVGLYQAGESAEAIVRRLEHLRLAQVYAALAYYHANREAMDREMAEEAEEERRIIEQHGADGDAEQA